MTISLTASADQPLRHGVTANDLARFARVALSKHIPSRGFGWDDRYEAALFGAVERLYASQDPPEPRELLFGAMDALDRMTRDDRKTRGFANRDSYAGPYSAPAFTKYWINPGPPSPEAEVINHVALAQIMSRLSPHQRRALEALATYEDYGRAAKAMGVPYDNFTTYVTQARKTFFTLWHEGEKPAGMWRRDKRTNRHTPRPRVAAVLADAEATTQVLRDVRDVFTAAGEQRMHSCDLLARLAARRPDVYGKWDQADLASVLRSRGVPTKRPIEIRGVNRNGYRLPHILDALDATPDAATATGKAA